MSFDNTRAISEGWSVTQVTFKRARTEFRIQRLENSRQFLSDDEVWSHVTSQAAFANDPYHIGALRFIERNNLKEFGYIEAHASLIGISGGLTQFFHLLDQKAA